MIRNYCVILLLVAFAGNSNLTAGQGLDRASLHGANETYQTFRRQDLARSAALRQDYRLNPAAVCSKASGSVCISRKTADIAALALATAPQSYEQRNPAHTGGIVAVSSASNQGDCNTCVSFAIGAAAETAVALALHKNASNWFSVQDLHFCATSNSGDARSCESAWSLQGALDAVTRLQSLGRLTTSKCLPYQSSSNVWDRADLCAYQCRDVYYDMYAGNYTYEQLTNLVDIQQWLRLNGSVATAIEIYKDFKPFFIKEPHGIYKGPGSSYTKEEGYGHAVVIVGYNNTGGYWLVKNSWGTGFADNGFFKIAYGASGIGDPSSTYGLRFSPYVSREQVQPWQITPIKGNAGCCKYKAGDGAYVGKVASMFGISPQAILLDNLVIIPQLDMWLAGKVLMVCSADIVSLLPPKTELEALLRFKKSVDQDNVLSTWVTGGGASASPCQWQGVQCDKFGKVNKIQLPGLNLVGGLPDASILQPLSNLQVLWLANNSLHGPLPANWGNLSQLRDLQVQGNSLTGTLPHQWSGMRNLVTLRLGATINFHCLGNRLTGSLPKEWSSWKQIQYLGVQCNMLTGTLPSEWAGMANLQKLYSANNKLRGPLPDQWSRLTGLTTLVLGAVLDGQCAGNMISGTLPASWANMRQLITLDLTCNQLTGTLPSQWSALSRLSYLYLSGNRLTGTLPKQWAAMYSLGEFYLGSYDGMRCISNMLTGTLPPEWSAWKKIETLALPCNRLSGSLPPAWGALSTVRALSLNDNQLSGPLPQQWASMTSLAEVYLKDNDFLGQVPSAWAKSMQLLRTIQLFGNPRLSGCLPPLWQPTNGAQTSIANFDQTGITGYC